MDLFDSDKQWDFENGFYYTSHVTRIAKLVAQYELYRQIIEFPGQIVECGVYKGASLIRLLTYREMLEHPFSRKVIGFDAFGAFPLTHDEKDDAFIEKFEKQGGKGLTKVALEQILERKRFQNYELVEGDINETVPAYLEHHPELRLALLHIDVDVYQPTRVILETLFDRVVKGGLIVLDDYGTVAGETRAVDEFIRGTGLEVRKPSISHIPAFIRK